MAKETEAYRFCIMLLKETAWQNWSSPTTQPKTRLSLHGVQILDGTSVYSDAARVSLFPSWRTDCDEQGHGEQVYGEGDTGVQVLRHTLGGDRTAEPELADGAARDSPFPSPRTGHWWNQYPQRRI